MHKKEHETIFSLMCLSLHRFLDFQGPHYHTPCIDVTYFINLSIQPEVRRKNLKFLLEFYHDSLISTLEKYGYTGSKPSFEEIEQVMERLSFYSFSMLAFLLPVMTFEASKEAFDVQKIYLSKGEEGYNMDIYKAEGLIEKLGPDLEYLVQKHFS